MTEIKGNDDFNTKYLIKYCSIYADEFNTYKPTGQTAKRIISDMRFEEKCKKNESARKRRI